MNDFHQPFFPGLDTDADKVALMVLSEITERAVALLRAHEPPEGYYLAFSGGKDSVVIWELAKLAGVKIEVHHNFTTIDPPELVRFVKSFPEVIIDMPEKNMFVRIAENGGGPPTRHRRWCCEEYKEGGGAGRSKIIGVRAAESPRRAARWNEVSKGLDKSPVICPIVYWTDAQVWDFIRSNGIKYCSLYDEGWKRLGCIGCPLANKTQQRAQFARWPRYAALWKKAVGANWERFHAHPRLDGKPRFHASFKNAEEFWLMWMEDRRSDYFREGCQSGFLFANEDESDSITPEERIKLYPDKDPDEEWTAYFERKGITP